MKIHLLLFLFVISFNWGAAQAVTCILTDYDNTPSINYRLDNLPDDILLGYVGDDNVWNYSHLRSPVQYKYDYKDSNNGMYHHLFESSDIMLVDPWGTERYYRKGSSGLVTVGIIEKSNDNDLLVKNYISPLAIPKKEPNRRYKNEGKFEIIIESWENSYLSKNNRGKIKIIGEEEISRQRDASGVMYLPGEVLNVLRTSVKKYVDIETFEYVEDKWQSVESSIVEDMNIDITYYQEEYIFRDVTTNDVVCIAYMNNYGQIESVLYKSSNIETIKVFDKSNSEEFILHPTVSFGNIRFDFLGFEAGYYRLKVYSILNEEVWNKSYELNGDRTFKEDLSFLSKGTYSYTLLDNNGNRLLFRRFGIIKP